MATNLSFRRGNTWTPSITVTAPFSLENFTAVAGLYEKAERLQPEIVSLAATVTPSVSGGTIDLILTATNSDTLNAQDYYLVVEINRVSDDYTYELDAIMVSVTKDVIGV